MNKEPLKDLAPMAIPHGTPIEATDDYYKSLKETTTRVTKYPAWDIARPSPQVLIVQSRRELMETEELLGQKRDEEAKYRTTMNTKWKDIRDTQMLLKQSFISFNKFIRENEEKRRRTDRLLDADIEMYERKCRETEEMKKRLAEMEEVKEKMEQQVRDYTIYEDYLMSVIQKYPQFKQPLDILNRYEALAAAKSYLAERQEREMEELGIARQEVAKLAEEKRLFVMGLNNKLADLRWRYDKVRRGVVKWDLALNRLKETLAKRNAEIYQVREAIWNLYGKICKQKGLDACAKKIDFEQQLVVIMRALLELRMIYKIASIQQKAKMRIKTFGKYIENIAQQRHQLNDSTLVIDGQNALYKFYVEKGLQFVFGCESNVFADCLKEYLSMFKKANVKCYFVFKGGHGNIEDKFNKKRDTDKGTVSGPEHNDFVQPIFMKDVYTQVLDEMGFDYVICEYESKKEIMALAQKLNCPVCSYDIEYFFSGIPYVLYPSIEYNQVKNKMTCSIITLDSFLQRFKLTDSLLAIFIVLTDVKMFPENHFMDFIKSLKIPIGNYKRNMGILQWLSKMTREKAVAHIFKYTTTETKTKFLKEEIYAWSMIRRQETTGLPTEYLLNGKAQIKERDPQWFEKGVISKHIAIPYINLYYSNIFLGSWAIADKEADDAILPSMKIIKYAYNLLTNFKKEGFTLHSNDFHVKDESMPVTVTDCVQKPNFNAIDSPFENGWDHVKSLGLFEHFNKESLPGFDFGRLEHVPENAKLLIIALVYYHHQKTNDVSNEACCLLLSYVALSLLNDDRSNTSSPNNSITDAKMISSHDKLVAMNILAPYFKEVTKNEADMIFDSKLIQPLVEFQHCLEQLNFLNKLCGCPYMPTVYSKTFNGTFVYKFLYSIKNEYEGNCLEFLKQLNPAASVLEFFNGLFASYKVLITK